MLFAPLRDQRRSERRWIALPVQIRMGKALMEGTTLNLSDHGMYLFTAANIALGSDIEIEFRQPEEKSVVRLCATVRRKVVYLYGIEFLEKQIDSAQRTRCARDDGAVEFPEKSPTLAKEARMGHPCTENR